MKRWNHLYDFKQNQSSKESFRWYDLYEDWDLIEASFAQQYGIRLRHEPYMPWSEFSSLLTGLNHETPLGQIISIRSEDDKDMLKNFSAKEKKLRNEWRSKEAKRLIKDNPDIIESQLSGLQSALKAAYTN